MKDLRRPILVFTLLTILLILNTIYAQEISWIEDFNLALEKSKETDKPIFIYFYSNKCYYCRKFEKDTLSDPEIVDLLLQNFIVVKINVHEQIELAYYFRIVGTPTLYVLLPNGTLIDNRYWSRWHPGSMSTSELKDYLLISLRIAGKNTDKSGQSVSEEAEDKSFINLENKELHFLVLPLAFGAGIISAFSPCILPLLPVFVSIQLKFNRKKLWLTSIGLILSLAILGALVGSLGCILLPFQQIVEQCAYTIMIVMGFLLVSNKLNRYFITVTSFLTQIASRKLEKAGGIVTGFLLGFLWSPCIGPILGSVLAYTAVVGSGLEGFLIMLFYSFGFTFSIFILTKVIEKAGRKIKGKNRKKEERKIRRKLLHRGRILEEIIGILLIILGILMLSGYGEQLLIYIPMF